MVKDSLAEGLHGKSMPLQARRRATAIAMRTVPRIRCIAEDVQILELARNAQRQFAKQEPREKRRLLNFLLSTCTWEDGEDGATFRQPFDLLAETAAIAAGAAAGEAAKTNEN